MKLPEDPSVYNLPWAADPPEIGTIGSIYDSDMNTIAQAMQLTAILHDPKQADRRRNAAFIALACNNHHALLGALSALRNECSGFIQYADQQSHGVTNIRVLQSKIDAATEAIDNARKKI